MICADLQAPESSKESNRDRILIVEKNINQNSGDASSRNAVLDHVIDQLTSDKNELVSTSQLDGEVHTSTAAPLPLPFRLCMANVLISACQKISDSGKKRCAKRVLPRLIPLVEVLQLHGHTFLFILIVCQYFISNSVPFPDLF